MTLAMLKMTSKRLYAHTRNTHAHKHTKSIQNDGFFCVYYEWKAQQNIKPSKECQSECERFKLNGHAKRCTGRVTE